jgi:hypothetical protein
LYCPERFWNGENTWVISRAIWYANPVLCTKKRPFDFQNSSSVLNFFPGGFRKNEKYYANPPFYFHCLFHTPRSWI